MLNERVNNESTQYIQPNESLRHEIIYSIGLHYKLNSNITLFLYAIKVFI